MKLIFTILLLPLVGIFSFAQKSYQVSSIPGGFVAEFPGEATYSVDTLSIAAMGQIEKHYFSFTFHDLDLSEVYFVLSYYDFPDEILYQYNDIQPELFDESIKAYAENYNAKIIYSHKEKLSGFKGRFVRMDTGAGLSIKIKVYLIGQRFYELSVLGKEQDKITQMVNSFFDSFKLLVSLPEK